MTGNAPVRIFCGADRSQQLAFRVLAHSIERHTTAAPDTASLTFRAYDLAIRPSASEATTSLPAQ